MRNLLFTTAAVLVMSASAAVAKSEAAHDPSDEEAFLQVIKPKSANN